MSKLRFKIILLIISIIFIFQQERVVASEVSPWAQLSVTQLQQEDFLREDSLKNFSADISRNDYAYLMYTLYKTLVPDGFIDAANQHVQLFSDSSDPYVLSLKKAGLINGYPDNTFRGNNKISREEIMQLYVNVLSAAGIELNLGDESDIKDIKQVTPWAKNAVLKCFGTGIIIGDGKGYIKPLDNASVEESLVVFLRIKSTYGLQATDTYSLETIGSIKASEKYYYLIEQDVFGNGIGIYRYNEFSDKTPIYEGEILVGSLFEIEDNLYFLNGESELCIINIEKKLNMTGNVISSKIYCIYGDELFYQNSTGVYRRKIGSKNDERVFNQLVARLYSTDQAVFALTLDERLLNLSTGVYLYDDVKKVDVDQGDGTFVYLNNQGELFYKDVLLLSAVNDFAMTKTDIFLVTTSKELKSVSLDNGVITIYGNYGSEKLYIEGRIIGFDNYFDASMEPIYYYMPIVLLEPFDDFLNQY